MPRSLLTFVLFSSLAMVFGACKPDYPKCDKDSHCKEAEFCVNGMCQKCRNDKDCSKGQECKAGRCEAIEGYCEDKDACPPGQICKNNRCSNCSSTEECGPGLKCDSNGRCVQCLADSDCPENHECQNGSCVAPPPPPVKGPCQPEAIYFDFNESVLTSQATAALRDAAKCIKSVSDRKMRLEGHCDPRGTEEYNLALGDRRARSVAKYLYRLGVKKRKTRTVSKGKLEATGSDESSWSQDRKVKFIWE